MDFGGLAVGVSRHDAFAEGLEAARLRLDPAAGVRSRPAFPEDATVVTSGAQGFVSGASRRAVFFPGPPVLADRDDRGGLGRSMMAVWQRRVS